MIAPGPRRRPWTVVVWLVFTLLFVSILDKQFHRWYCISNDMEKSKWWIDRRSVRWQSRDRVRFLLARQAPDGQVHMRWFELDYAARTMTPEGAPAERIPMGSVSERLFYYLKPR